MTSDQIEAILERAKRYRDPTFSLRILRRNKLIAYSAIQSIEIDVARNLAYLVLRRGGFKGAKKEPENNTVERCIILSEIDYIDIKSPNLE